jgi:hypothetical protein
MIAPANRQDGHRAPAAPRERIPVRTIGVTIGMLLATAAILLLGWAVRQALTWIVVATLFSVIISPLVRPIAREGPQLLDRAPACEVSCSRSGESLTRSGRATTFLSSMSIVDTEVGGGRARADPAP